MIQLATTNSLYIVAIDLLSTDSLDHHLMQDKYKLSTSIIIRKKDPVIHILVFELRSSQLMYINIWHRINYTGKMRKAE